MRAPRCSAFCLAPGSSAPRVLPRVGAAPALRSRTPPAITLWRSKHFGIDALGTVLVEVETYGGHVGVGISIGGPPACFIVEEHLSRFVEGQDCRNLELMWDQVRGWGGVYGFTGCNAALTPHPPEPAHAFGMPPQSGGRNPYFFDNQSDV